MSTLVYMKILERTPEKYDRGMRILTLGRIDRIKLEIASLWVKSGHYVLEIGCGTGRLAALMTARGAHVAGIDISESMLTAARRNAPEAELIHMTATEIDKLERNRFDRIVATLSLSELEEDEIAFVLRDSFVLLKTGGKLIIADEVKVPTWRKRFLACFVSWPLSVLTFLLTRNTTHALKRLEGRLEQTGFRIVARKNYLLGTLALIVAEKT
ncbi:MAG: class I SAM-dependent methyltransferase [Epsilonproteobacteria bacterium]|nr:class I SAM-dependent methyltransferase [Campylobacterota bacterium]